MYNPNSQKAGYTSGYSLDKKSRAQAIKSQARQVAIILFIFHLPQIRWIFKNPMEFGF